MRIDGVSIWGVVLVLLLAGMALSLFWLVDKRTFSRSLKAMVVMTVQLLLAGVYVWGLYELDSWLVNVAWLMLMSLITAYLCLGRNRLPWMRFLPVVSLSVFAGCLVMGGCMLLAFKPLTFNRLFVPVMAVLVGGLLHSMTLALRTYIISLRYTAAHRMFLQANGATHLEAVMPCVRRALRAALLPQLRSMSSPLLLAMPMLLCGMLICGCEVVPAVVVTLLFMMAGFAATVLSTALTLWLADRKLFDVHGNFIV